MLFKVTGKDAQNNIVVMYYDNITQHVFDHNKTKIDFRDDPKFALMVNKKPVSNKKPRAERKRRYDELIHLKLQLGLNCNFHCKYCNQRHDRALDSNLSSEHYQQTVDNLIDRFKQLNLKCKYVTLWGGEPFMYFKLLKILVPRLHQYFGEDCLINTITNGSLLNDKVTDFIIQNRIGITISHDGANFNVYRDDKNPLDNPKIVKNIQRIYDAYKHYDDIKDVEYKPGLTINVVVSPDNCDVLSLHQYFTSKIGREIKFHFEGIVKCDSTSVDVVKPFDAVSRKTLIDHVFAAGIGNPNSPYYSLRSITSGFVSNIVNEQPITVYRYSCDVDDPLSLSVNVDGTVLACHSSTKDKYKIGNLYQDQSPDFDNPFITRTADRPKCYSCPVVMLCKGGCPLSSQEDHDIACQNLKLWYSGFFAATWKVMFDLTLVRIENADNI